MLVLSMAVSMMFMTMSVMPMTMMAVISMTMSVMPITMMAVSVFTLESISVAPGAFGTARLFRFPAGSGNIIAPFDSINILQIEHVCESLLTEIRTDFGSRERIAAISPGVNSN